MPEDQEQPTFEKGLEELEEIVRKLEGGDLSLEQSLKLFEQGVQLSQRCRKQLQEAETKIEILLKKDDVRVPEPFDVGTADQDIPF